MNEKKYFEIYRKPFTPEFEAILEEKVIPYVDKEHWEILMKQVGEICLERAGWNNCDNIYMLVEQLKIELKVIMDFNKEWKYQE